MKQGEPYEDELSKRVILNASARTFQIGLYWMLAIMHLERFFADALFDSEKLSATQALAGAICGSSHFLAMSSVPIPPVG